MGLIRKEEVLHGCRFSEDDPLELQFLDASEDLDVLEQTGEIIHHKRVG